MRRFRTLVWVVLITGLLFTACSESDEDERRSEESRGQAPSTSSPSAPSGGTEPAPSGAPGGSGR